MKTRKRMEPKEGFFFTVREGDCYREAQLMGPGGVLGESYRESLEKGRISYERVERDLLDRARFDLENLGMVYEWKGAHLAYHNRIVPFCPDEIVSVQLFAFP